MRGLQAAQERCVKAQQLRSTMDEQPDVRLASSNNFPTIPSPQSHSHLSTTRMAQPGMHAPAHRLTPNRQQGVRELEDAHAPLEPVV